MKELIPFLSPLIGVGVILMFALICFTSLFVRRTNKLVKHIKDHQCKGTLILRGDGTQAWYPNIDNGNGTYTKVPLPDNINRTRI